VTLYHTRSHPPGLNTSRYDRADDLLAEAARAPDLAGRKAVRDLLDGLSAATLRRVKKIAAAAVRWSREHMDAGGTHR
jgi:hypothetical protein